MNTALKVGLWFQAIQLTILGACGLIWLFLQLHITELGIILFMWISMNIGSLVLIISGIAKEPARTHHKLQ